MADELRDDLTETVAWNTRREELESALQKAAQELFGHMGGVESFRMPLDDDQPNGPVIFIGPRARAL